MGQFYIDDSVHDDAGFVIGACVYTDIEVDEKIIGIIKSWGFDPNRFEYKSSANYSLEPEKVKVREELKELLTDCCRLGIVVIPRTHREQLGLECIKAVKQFIDNNKRVKKPTSIYLDQGMFASIEKAKLLITELNFTGCVFHLEQNSLDIKGIQLADLAAHISSIQLKDELGLVTKMVKSGHNFGYDPELEMELGFEVWATIRYTFFNQGSKLYSGDPIADATLSVEPYGLYISNLCDEGLSDIARAKFGNVYLDCIH
jgi:hypothetical protein